ncbi:hypothetical protein [Robertmurraya siralis]|uniref:hypothetical protein n=1 Tax=Robertmurraya siralis TaxID=77777 RepID=UPI0010F6CEAD|nr:hypothetical protein [Robertmurraya siralis]
MRISHYKTITETREKETGYTAICNMCGKENIFEENDDSLNDDTQHIELHFGYGSKFDMERWSFDLCDDCLIEIVKQFKYVPEGFYEDSSLNLTPEEHQKIFDNWKETGEWEELKFKSYEEIVALNNGWYPVDLINEAIKKYYPDKPELIPPSED